MKNRIFMYLFIFALLLVVFQYVNSKNILEDYESKMAKKEAKFEKYQDTINNLRDRVLTLSEFSIENSEPALSYFEEQGYRVNQLIPLVKEELYELNSVKGEEHPLIPYPSLSGGKMQIDAIRILNHKWVVTNFSDGKYWGELFLTYEINEDQKVIFNREASFIYPVY
ncbi:hydrolase [Hanstruepera ponticola]|uniref:hydrolase n=1 Tax=Hanstruepera ponticola TaxID=2042995 RepID=UPI001F17C356|nr:hydrolase [Hanstruepera ponticola]